MGIKMHCLILFIYCALVSVTFGSFGIPEKEYFSTGSTGGKQKILQKQREINFNKNRDLIKEGMSVEEVERLIGPFDENVARLNQSLSSVTSSLNDFARVLNNSNAESTDFKFRVLSELYILEFLNNKLHSWEFFKKKEEGEIQDAAIESKKTNQFIEKNAESITNSETRIGKVSPNAFSFTSPCEPLFAAIAAGDLPLIKTMFDSSKHLTCTLNGYTPLMAASLNEFEDIVKFFLDHGADATARSYHNKTASELTDNQKIKELLQKFMNKLENNN